MLHKSISDQTESRYSPNPTKSKYLDLTVNLHRLWEKEHNYCWLDQWFDFRMTESGPSSKI